MAESLNLNTLRGFALPVRVMGAAATPFLSASGSRVLWGKLVLAIGIPLGTRPMRRSFGGTLRDVLFSNVNTRNSDARLHYAVLEAVGTHVPTARVSLQRVKQRGTQVHLSLSFSDARSPRHEDSEVLSVHSGHTN